jgi:protein-tyrosine phosphatase
MESPSYRVLFVCMGNICRSPAGENIFRHKLRQAGHETWISCDSAGTGNWHAGNGPDRRTARTLRKREVPVEGSARQFEKADFRRFNLILAMDDDNRREILGLATLPEERSMVRPFTDFCRNHSHSEVPDPYYGGKDGFELVADLMEDGAAGLLEYILHLRDDGP